MAAMEAIGGTAYTTDTDLRMQMTQRLKELRMSITEVAMRMNYHRTVLSKYLNGKYTADPTEVEKKIREFLKETEYELTDGGQTAEAGKAAAHSPLPSKVEYFESRDYLQVLGVCQSCQEDAALGIIVGRSGQGKTHALKQYASLPRTAYIECDDTMACRDLVEAIENRLGMPKSYGGTIWSRVNRIREFFNINPGYLLIIDEADKLINKYTQKKMEILRGIFDQSRVGVVIAGEPRLESELKGNLVRFANRLDFYYKIKGLNRQEVESYLSEFEIEDKAMNELVFRATNEKGGCFRLLDRTLMNVLRILKDRGDYVITMKTVIEASGMMML